MTTAAKTGMSKARKRVVALAAAAVLVSGLIVFLPQRDLPAYEGKTVAQWFAAFEAAGGHGRWISGGNQKCTRAMVAGLGHPALPFLNREARRRLRLRQTKSYSKMLNALPRAVARKLPSPQPDSRINALRLTAAIGSPGLETIWGTGWRQKDTTPCAVRTLRWALAKAQLRSAACQGIAEIGPEACEAVPDLMKLLPRTPGSFTREDCVLMSLAALQASASNAVPALITIVTNEGFPRSTRVQAAFTLGEIGAAASSAGAAVGQLFVENRRASKDRNSIGLECVLASIGDVPDEAVPELETLLATGGDLQRTYAAVALWSYAPGDPAYSQTVRDILAAPLNPGNRRFEDYCAAPAISVLAEHGPQARVFEPEPQALTAPGNTVRHLAEHALKQIQGGTNYVQTRKF